MQNVVYLEKKEREMEREREGAQKKTNVVPKACTFLKQTNRAQFCITWREEVNGIKETGRFILDSLCIQHILNCMCTLSL